MNKKYFNTKYKEASKVILDISELKKDISNLKNEISIKKDVLNSTYLSKMQNSSQKESRIKALMDNRHFRYMKMIDFITEEDISEKQGFFINKDSGFVMSEIIKKPEVKLFSKMVNPSNSKEIIFEYDTSTYSNLISFGFKNKSGLPITPKNIKIEYGDNLEDFFEPNFRYYNRNSSNVFLNNFFFYPKKIKRIYVTFPGEYDFNSAKCSLYSCVYSLSKDSFVDINIKNTGKLSNFNIYKNSDENNVPLVFEYTEDNTLYKPMVFKNKETVLELEKNSDFKIRIKADYENVEQKEFTESKKANISVKDMVVIENSHSFDLTGKITNCEIVFTQSAYKKLRGVFQEIFNGKVEIGDFVTIENNIYKVRKEFVSIINEPTEEILNMVLQDDISELENNRSIFSFYIHEKGKKIFFSSFMLDFNFYLQLETEIVIDSIPNDMLTPYLFDLQVKG